ncbi:MAG: APC family permease, partial [Dehalococcoidia bacterium]|nr:APC family permease [Dehalococcoidia bacterium]
MDDRDDKLHHRPGDKVVHRRQFHPNRSIGRSVSPPGGEGRDDEQAEAVGTGATSLSRVHRPGDRLVRYVNLRGARLRRVLGVSGLFSTGYGNVGSSIYYALGITAMFALGAAPIALTIAGVFFVLTVLTYTEATVAVPEAGGASSFSRRGLGEIPSFVAGWVTLLSYTVTIAISAYTAGSYLAIFFPILSVAPYNVIFAVCAILFLMGLNVVGVQEAASLSVVFAVLDLLTQIVLVVVGGIFLLNLPLLIGQINFGVAPTWSNFFFG